MNRFVPPGGKIYDKNVELLISSTGWAQKGIEEFRSHRRVNREWMFRLPRAYHF